MPTEIPSKHIIAKDPLWASTSDRAHNRQGVVGTFTKPLKPLAIGDPYDRHAVGKTRNPELYHAKKEASAMCFNIDKQDGKRLKALVEPHDRWIKNGPLRGFTPFKPLGGPGGGIPRKEPADASEKKWKNKMQRARHKFFGSSNLVARGAFTHNIKQGQFRELVDKENRNLNILKTMLLTRGKDETEGEDGRKITRRRARTVQSGDFEEPHADPPGAIKLVEDEPGDSLYSTQKMLYDNVLNPSTRFVHDASTETQDTCCPKCKRDVFFCPHTHDIHRARRLGGARSSLSSSEIGTGSLAALRSPSPPRRKFSMKPGVTKFFRGDVATESAVAFRNSPEIPGTTVYHHSDRFK